MVLNKFYYEQYNLNSIYQAQYYLYNSEHKITQMICTGRQNQQKYMKLKHVFEWNDPTEDDHDH